MTVRDLPMSLVAPYRKLRDFTVGPIRISRQHHQTRLDETIPTHPRGPGDGYNSPWGPGKRALLWEPVPHMGVGPQAPSPRAGASTKGRE